MFIVNFHNVVSGPLDAYDRSIAPRLDVTQFISAIDWLARRFRFISLDELISQFRRPQSGERAAVALTFDDGYLDVLHHAFPILEKRGIVASVMVVTQALESPSKLFHFEELELAFRTSNKRTLELPGQPVQSIATTAERIACLKALKQELKLQPEPERKQNHERLLDHLGVTSEQLEHASVAFPALRKLNVEHLKFLVESGWTVGAHTHTHRTLSCLDEVDERMEIVGSRDAMQACFGATKLAFAYPYGGPQHIGRRAHEIVASSGYSCALTTTPGRNTPDTDIHQLRRINIEDLYREQPEILDGCVDDHGSTDDVNEQPSVFRK